MKSEKQTQSKPKQTQFKANSKPISKMPKMNASNVITMNYKYFPRWWGTKTNPIQTQTKLVLSAVEWANLCFIFLVLSNFWLIQHMVYCLISPDRPWRLFLLLKWVFFRAVFLVLAGRFLPRFCITFVFRKS